MSLRFFFVALLVLALPAFGASDGDDDTIRPSDVPKDAPRPQDYPAKPYTGPNAVPDVKSDLRSKRYRTELTAWGKEKPNFAGHYILATWGCGTGCTEIAIIDAISGKVFHPAGARMTYSSDVDAELLVDEGSSPRRSDFGSLRYSADSRLLVLFGVPENRAENRGISYFVWENDALKRIRFVPVKGRKAK